MRVLDIERFLCNTMTADERMAFERDMENDSSLKFDVRLLSCIMQQARAVYGEDDRRMKALFLRAKQEYGDSFHREVEFFREHPNIAAYIPMPGDRQYMLCRYEYRKSVLSKITEDTPKSVLSDIMYDDSLYELVISLVTKEEGTSILGIVRECISQFGLKYSGMKVDNWVSLVRQFVVFLTSNESIEPYEYFVCAAEDNEETED